MEYRTLGRTGIKVSPLCLGAMMFGAWGTPDHDECIRIIHAALDAGINFVDTADIYSFGESEEIVGKALVQKKRHQVVLATKVHGQMGRDPNAQGNSRRWIMAECDNSLRRLGTDYIDLYQIHRPSPETDIDETLGALTDLVRAGKIRYFGSSTFPAHEVVEAQWVAERRARERFVTEQPPYSILVRGIEKDVLPICQKYGMGVLSWSPLAGGWLSGAFGPGKENTSRRAAMIPQHYDMSLPGNQEKLEAVSKLTGLADGAGMSLVSLALGFVLAHPGVTSPIIGPRTMEHLESQLPALDVRLSDDVLDQIDQVVAPGIDLNRTDVGWEPAAIADKSLRRRRGG
jgi:aryl-alcohol dehydrogenase-like predicted oxidoreductase